jgi:DNA-binding transcriptional MocR family regulator
MMQLSSTREVAAKIGVNKATVIRMARRHNVGTWIDGRPAFTEAEVRVLAKNVRSAGNPNFIPGNYFGKPPKKPRKSKNSSP